MNILKNAELWITLLLVALSISVCGSEPLVYYTADSVIVTPGFTTNAIINPGKGWVLYGKVKEQPREIMAIGSLGYSRYQWGDLEPSEGVYKWDIIDKDIKEWAKAGKKFAFGVMCANTHSREFWVTPKWVFDAGARYNTFELKNPKNSALGIPGVKLMPIFDDSIYIKKMTNFIRAFAARYDGNPNIAFIDIRSYGNWGEGHMYPTGIPDISPVNFKEHIQIHRDAFHKTLLQIATENQNYISVYDWAISEGIGLRCDGICANRNGSSVAKCAEKIPAVFELYGKVELLKELSWWFGTKDKWDRGFRLEECVEIGKPTYCDLSRGGQSGFNLLKSEPSLVTKLNNRLGYHFVLAEAKFPRLLSSNKSATIKLKWENKGIANIFIPAKVSFALISKTGKVVQVCDATTSIPAFWKSDIPSSVTDELLFDNIKPGNYVLAVGISQPNDGLKPTIKLGINQKNTDGWYELSTIVIN